MKQDRLREVKAEWPTYERQFVDPPDTTTKLSTQPAPRIGVWTARPATDAEIAEEVAKRLERNCEATKRAEFESRQDYKDAKAIASALEWITPQDHCLDRLKPEEWAELRRRLEA
jgi:hypothetical protein